MKGTKTIKFLTTTLTVIALTLSNVAFAATPTTTILDSLSSSALTSLKQIVGNNLEIAKDYAYLDVSETSPEAKEVILAARENIIYHEA